jgi:hypothetical protein
MNLLIFISSIFYTVIHAQTFQREKAWISDKNLNFSSFYSSLNFEKIDTSANKLNFSPDLFTAYQNEEFAFLTGFKIHGQSQFSQKFKANYLLSSCITNTVVTPYIGNLQARSYFFNKLGTDLFFANDLRFRMNYSINKHLEFQGGIDHHIIGEGNRSLLSGNQGISSPFLLLKSSIWKFDYYSVHQIWREGQSGNYIPKASSTHYLNFNLGKKFSFGIFESVVHVIKDTIYNRGFEVEYLNPLILYRPQEYSIGSSDNVLLGLNGFLTWKKHRLYGQIIIDDINVQEIRKKSKWWANKYGIQAGYKTWGKFKQKDYFFRTEINYVTAFTYAAQNLSTSYSNQSLAIAHPLGSNFVEWFSELIFQHNHYEFETWLQLYMKGNDFEGNPASFGGDILKSYSLRPFGDYGYPLGVGEKIYRFHFGSKISRTIGKKDWKLFVEPRFVITKIASDILTNPVITLGFHHDFGAGKRNY